MLSKKQILKSIYTLPDHVSIDQIVDHLIYIEKIEKGLSDSTEGKINTVEEAKVKLKKWLK